MRNMDIKLKAYCIILTALLMHQIEAFTSPRIVEHPIDTVVPRNDPVTLNCKSEGSPNPTILWYKDGMLLKSSQHRNILPMGNLFFLKAVKNDGGVYVCEAKNELGVARSRNATMIVAETTTGITSTTIDQTSPPECEVGNLDERVCRIEGEVEQFHGNFQSINHELEDLRRQIEELKVSCKLN